MVNAAAMPAPSATFPAQPASRRVDWTVSAGPVPYPEAVAAMEARVAAILAGKAAEQVWLLEHPALYTAGTSARAEDLLDGGEANDLST